MAKIYEPTEEQKSEWNTWVASRPECVRKVAEQFNPWSLYKLKTSGHRVTLYSFGGGEDGSVTLTVIVSGDFNAVTFERKVFGINPDELEPCDLPTADEPLGVMLTEESDIKAFIDEIRPTILANRAN